MRNLTYLIGTTAVLVILFINFGDSENESSRSSEAELPVLSLKEDVEASKAVVKQKNSGVIFRNPAQEQETSQQVVEIKKTIEQEARDYIEDITAPELEPLSIESADHFITGQQVISLIPDDAITETTAGKLLANPDINAGTPVTIVRTTEQIEVTTAADLLRQAGGSLNQTIQILEDDEQTRRISIAELAEEYKENPDKQITLIRSIDHVEILTAKEIQDETANTPDSPIKVITQAYSLPSTTISELLMGDQAVSADDIFYVRTITEQDKQGVWGIIHHGLVENFARGIAIRQGKNIDTYKVAIPEDADERQVDESSSYLGQQIFQKSLNSYVYNFIQARMGRNPDIIHPGNELVIIHFNTKELISIYKFFINQNT